MIDYFWIKKSDVQKQVDKLKKELRKETRITNELDSGDTNNFRYESVKDAVLRLEDKMKLLLDFHDLEYHEAEEITQPAKIVKKHDPTTTKQV